MPNTKEVAGVENLMDGEVNGEKGVRGKGVMEKGVGVEKVGVDEVDVDEKGEEDVVEVDIGAGVGGVEVFGVLVDLKGTGAAKGLNPFCVGAVSFVVENGVRVEDGGGLDGVGALLACKAEGAAKVLKPLLVEAGI